jgi:hypothetical protein
VTPAVTHASAETSAAGMSILDDVAFGAPDLAFAVDDLQRRLGVRAADGGQQVGIGTHNALIGLGPGPYLDVIAPDPEQPAAA